MNRYEIKINIAGTSMLIRVNAASQTEAYDKILKSVTFVSGKVIEEKNSSPDYSKLFEQYNLDDIFKNFGDIFGGDNGRKKNNP